MLAFAVGRGDAPDAAVQEKIGNGVREVPDQIARAASQRESQILDQFLGGDASLLENGLQGLGFDRRMHGDAGMQRSFVVVPMRAGLPNKFKPQASQRPTDFLTGEVARQFHATCAVKTGS